MVKRRDDRCAVHRHQFYVPLEVHHIHPKAWGGSDDPSNLVAICANAHTLVHDYIRLLARFQNGVPWLKRRLYGRKVRDLAQQGWEHIQAEQRRRADEIAGESS